MTDNPAYLTLNAAVVFERSELRTSETYEEVAQRLKDCLAVFDPGGESARYAASWENRTFPVKTDDGEAMVNAASVLYVKPY